MDTIEETRKKRLALLVKQYGSAAKLSRAIDISESQISHWRNSTPDYKTGRPRTMDSDTARKIEVLTNKEVGWMDQPLISENDQFLNAIKVLQSTPLEVIQKHKLEDLSSPLPDKQQITN